MKSFCGEKFWDKDLTWNTSYPQITNCFIQTTLVFIPSGFLWLNFIFEYFKLKSLNKSALPWSLLNLLKLIINLFLLLINILELSVNIYNLFTKENVYSVEYVTPLIKSITFALSLSLLLAHRSKGKHTSGTLFFFWLLFVVYALANYWSLINFYMKKNNLPIYADTFYFVFRILEFPLFLSIFFLNCFAETKSEFIRPGEQLFKKSPLNYVSYLSELTFFWVNSLIKLGYKKPLTQNDLWDLDKEYTSDYLVKKFSKNLRQPSLNFNKKLNKKKLSFNLDEEKKILNKNENYKEEEVIFEIKNSKNQNILFPILKTFRFKFFILFILKFVDSFLIFAGPYILDELITFVSSNEPKWKGYFLIFLIFIFSIGESLINNHYEYQLACLNLSIQTILTTSVYKKGLLISSEGRKNFSTGKITNIMSVDVSRVVSFLNMVNIIWSAPIQIFICIYLLWQQLGISALSAVIIMILLIPLNGFYTERLRVLNSTLMIKKDNRTKLFNELLNGIKIVKFYCWEKPFKSKINFVRNEEIKMLKKICYYSLGVVFAFSCTTFIVSISSFTTYILIDSNNILTPNKAFVTISLVNILRLPFGLLPIAAMLATMFMVSLKRLNLYFNSDEINLDSIEKMKDDNYSVKIEDGNFVWEKNEEPFLKNINLKIKHNELIAIVGKIGSGKSSLISSLIGEMLKISGHFNIDGNVSYVPQEAWIINASIRDNIILMNPFDKQKYNKILNLCALEKDIEILKAKDLTEIGEKGINLSGGQKQRISLARACYFNSDIYLFDDPLSSVDSHVSKHIFDKIIGPNGYLRNKTRILVTHKVTILPETDKIIVLKNGEISEQGSYKELVDDKNEFSEILNFFNNFENEEVKKDTKMIELSESFSLEKSLTLSLIKSGKIQDEKGKLVTKELDETGSIKFSVITKFLKETNTWLSSFVFIFIVIQSIFNISTNLWLSSWSNDNLDPLAVNNTSLRTKRLVVYGVLGFFDVFFNMLSAVALNLTLIRASKYLNMKMLDNILRCPIQFFDTTPVGRIQNRLTKDLDTIDVTLPFGIRILLSNIMRTIVSIIFFCIETPIFLVVMLPISFFYIILQKYYIASSRQLKRISSSTRSPIYAYFSEAINGLSSIRAFNLAEKFIQECNRRIDLNNKCNYPAVYVSRWLTIRIEFLGYIIVFLTGLFAILFRDTLSPGLIGLALSYSLSFTGLLSMFIKTFSDTEINLVSVERCIEYTKLESEAPTKTNIVPNKNWPDRGTIKFKNYSTRYRKDLENVLKNITLEILPNEKVGICGRTGAGKSSLTLALFRIIEPTEGTIEIDDVDITKIGLDDLRSKLTIIPQDAFLIQDILRSNLDPFSIYTDDQIWEALEQAHLSEYVRNLPEGLSYKITENGTNLSVGQRQLICLARALLRKTKLLILDEATASIDFETDLLIQETIRKEFKNCTILTIAHRLNTILDNDKVLVLDNGKVAEFDNPQNLLKNSNSIFYSLAKESNIV